MKDITEAQWEASRPKISALEGINFCLERFYRERKKTSDDDIGGGLSYEELIGVLLVARDELLFAKKVEEELDEKHLDECYTDRTDALNRFPFFWPETRFALENTAGQQIDHFLSEVDEITELGPGLQTAVDNDDLGEFERVQQQIDLEMMDAHHSLETWMRIRIRERGADYLRMLRSKVISKNSAPGREYYGEKG